MVDKKDCKFRLTDWHDGLTDLTTDGRQVQYLSQKGKGRIEFSITSMEPGGNSEQNGIIKIFFYITQIEYFTRPFEKSLISMENCRIGFSITFLEPGGNSEPNGNVQIFFYINSNCVFSKTTWKKRCSPMEKGRIEFSKTSLEPREIRNQMAMFKYFAR